MVVAAVGGEALGPPPRAADPTAHGRHALDERDQLGDARTCPSTADAFEPQRRKHRDCRAHRPSPTPKIWVKPNAGVPRIVGDAVV